MKKINIHFLLFPILILIPFIISCKTSKSTLISVNNLTYTDVIKYVDDDNSKYSNILPQVDYTIPPYTNDYQDPKMLNDLDNKLTSKNIINGLLSQEHDKLSSIGEDLVVSYSLSLSAQVKDSYLIKFSYNLFVIKKDSNDNTSLTHVHIDLKQGHKVNILFTIYNPTSNKFHVNYGVDSGTTHENQWPFINVEPVIINNREVNPICPLDGFAFDLSKNDLKNVTYPTYTSIC